MSDRIPLPPPPPPPENPSVQHINDTEGNWVLDFVMVAVLVCIALSAVYVLVNL